MHGMHEQLGGFTNTIRIRFRAAKKMKRRLKARRGAVLPNVYLNRNLCWTDNYTKIFFGHANS